MSDRALFDFGSSDLRPTSEDRLERLLRLLEDVDGTVRVVGHTDDVGGDSINQPLSEARAEAVAEHLAANGIDANRIETEGRAASEPVEPNQHLDGSDNPEGRQANRRVEVIVEFSTLAAAHNGGRRRTRGT
jgi:outer membrane protein OmpA-like peptidoglycan-associated protein